MERSETHHVIEMYHVADSRALWIGCWRDGADSRCPIAKTTDVQRLFDRYVAAARDHGAANTAFDSARLNRAANRIVSALRALDAVAPGRGVLAAALEIDDASVQTWAATHLLSTEHRLLAERTLEAVALCRGIIGSNARIVLQQWRAGRLTPTQ